MKMTLIAPNFPVKGQRVLTLPSVAAEFDRFFDIEIQDENVQDIEYSTDSLVGISAFIFQLPAAFEMARKFKELGAKVIMGGTGPSCLPELCLEHADAVVKGEVEGLGQKIADDFVADELRGVYSLPAPPDLATMRTPRMDLLSDGDGYLHRVYPLEFSRGCPHQCSFCYSHEMFMTYRTRPIEDIIRMVECRDGNFLFASDLNIGANPKFLKNVCRALAEFDDIEWWGEITLASLEDDELLDLLEKSHCKNVYVGLESISERSLNTFNKKHNKPEDYKRIISKVQDHGMTVGAGYIVGLDGEDKSIFERSVEFFEDVKLNYVTPTFITYLPGTKKFNELKAEGRIISEKLEDYDGFHATVQPDMMSLEELHEGVEWFIKEFFSPRSINVRKYQKPVFKDIKSYSIYHELAWGTSLYYNNLITRNKEGKSPLSDREKFDRMTRKRLPSAFSKVIRERMALGSSSKDESSYFFKER